MSKDNDYFLPKVAEADFEDFRLMMRDMPNSYQEWSEWHNRRVEEYGPNGELGPGVIHEIPVSPADFKKYCDREDKLPSGRTLLDYAEHVGRPAR